ncbi:MAG: AAA family ATPase [Nanoarchaeota archaeon]|nr:AAA family ATPase [Nanoarchaeota archaeon]
MVRIDKIEMQGFKSFAKKTLMTFPSSFSTICGPNGSGKSNVLDAVCFVLGRSSAKGLRADKMLEVIFNGGKGKQPAEFAKVAIFFDNSDKRFPLEESQIAVSRKINRKGVSIYKLNGRTVTREKILEVLHAANIQPDGHNIILQGNVTEIIEMSPLERREIIDEISGIAEFDEKRTKAQRELLTVENRLKESSIVLTERAAQISKLEQESKAAEEYQKLSKELDIFRASAAHKKLSEAESAMGALDGKIKEKEAASAELDKEFQGEEDGLSEKEKELGELEKKLFNRSKDISIIREVEKLRSEIMLKKNKIESNKIEIERTSNIIEKLNMLQQRSMEQSASRPVQEILRLNRTGVYGTIASLSKVSGEYQTAIEVAAGSHLHDIVVADSSIAVECIKFLKQNRIGRATFLPLDKIRPRYGELPKKEGGTLGGNVVSPGVVDLAINLIDFDRKYLNAFSFIFGDTVIVDRIDTAKQLGFGKRYVTLDGDLIEKSGAMIGGFYHKERKSLFEANEIKKYQTQKEQLEDGAAKIDGELIGLEKQLRALQTEEEKGSTELTDTEKQREQISLDMQKTREKRKAVYEKRLIIQSDVNRLKIQKARLEAELDNLKLEFNNYKKENLLEEKIEILEAKLKETFIAIQKLGPINMKAVEEFAQQNAVYNELKERVEKLSAERDKILFIMIEIESRRKETFSKTLAAVSEQFKTVFQDLTGGEADLHLEEDSLDSGLVIEASPAGKRLLNIDSMSGGEKTLVALAFLFAIQRFRPAPFYILDEVDAALDKPNSRKIVDLVKKYAEDAQFIIISHNDTTIQQADCVYGVSMENGESRLVGIRMPG